MEELMELYEIDIRNILEGQVEAEKALSEKLFLASSKINSNIAEKYEKHFNLEKEFMKRSSEFKHVIPELNNQILNAEKNSDTKTLNNKRLDNEMSKTVDCRDLLKARIEESKNERESLALQVIEKEKELEEKKEEKKADFDSLKRACFIYKEKLNMRIRGEFERNNEEIIVTFFYKKYNDKYCVHLSRNDSIWRVNKIEPELKVEHQKELNEIVNFAADSKVNNITVFLCKMRKIFFKHYCK
ncbi:uncharacterized protein LOC122506570 [Leptopilina heterotoma]|uniref:uncharacterized protein LOC122506570 n=1 Tax=Leptopilina heterotoma TaxID=63436 RepID=UPI001CAA2EF5|nr:uncharacterized protein LOC122506570 [Leptopilina heterotoma]